MSIILLHKLRTFLHAEMSRDPTKWWTELEPSEKMKFVKNFDSELKVDALRQSSVIITMENYL